MALSPGEIALHSAVNASQTNEAFLFLATFTSADGKEIIRLVNNNEDIVSRGMTYYAFPFDLNLPFDDGEKQANVSMTIGGIVDDSKMKLIEILRSTLKPPTVKIEVIISSMPNWVERSIDFLEMRNVTYDAMSITIDLVSKNILARKFPSDIYDPVSFPDLFY